MGRVGPETPGSPAVTGQYPTGQGQVGARNQKGLPAPQEERAAWETLSNPSGPSLGAGASTGQPQGPQTQPPVRAHGNLGKAELA